MRVLLVEDHRALCEEIRHSLQAIADVRVVEVCATSSAARAWLARHPDGWDLALVDIFLQQGNGFDVLRACARRSERQKVVVISNYTREPARDHARQAGADAFFDKALELEALLDYCESLAADLRPYGAGGPSLHAGGAGPRESGLEP